MMRFSLVDCDGFSMGGLRGVGDISPCVLENGPSVVVWQRDLGLLDSLEESDEAGAWSLMSAYAKLGLAVLEAMLEGACCLKAQPSAGRHLKRKLSHCASLLMEMVAVLRRKAVYSDAGSSAEAGCDSVLRLSGE